MNWEELFTAERHIQDNPDGHDLQGNPYVVQRNEKHVQVLKVLDKAKGKIFYRKIFQPGFTEWIDRENRFLLLFNSQKLEHTVVLRGVLNDDKGVASCIETHDAGLTIDEWQTLSPSYANNLQLPHPFVRGENLLRLLAGCLQALLEIHRLGIKHCDIKADNVCLPFVRQGGQVQMDFAYLRLIDFSFSLGEKSYALSHNKLPMNPDAPTADYLSPLLKAALQDKSNAVAALNGLDYRIDLYSLGWMVQDIQNSTPFLYWDNDERSGEGRAVLRQTLDKLLELGSGQGGFWSRFSVGLPHQGLLDKLHAFLRHAQPQTAFMPNIAPNPAPPNRRRTPATAILTPSKITPVTPLPPSPSKPPISKSNIPNAPEKPVDRTISVWKPEPKPIYKPHYVAGQEFKDADFAPTLVVVRPGNFMMGSPSGFLGIGKKEGRDDNEEPQHQVNINYCLAVGKYPVTFAEWDAYAAAVQGTHRPDDQGWGRSNRPVIDVSWEDAQGYVQWLQKMTGQPYRLLSETEWEYVCRAGTSTAFSTGNTITTDQANFDGNYTYNGSHKGVYRQQTTPVGRFVPNAFGLYDLHGNVCEWVQDCYQDSYYGMPTDGTAVKSSNYAMRVLRGGSWNNDPRDLRSAIRGYGTPGGRFDFIGFRITKTLP